MEPQTNPESLPPIPTKQYFTIGEVGELCAVKPHVLRYWEQEFPELRQVRRRGNRRYYRPHEVLLIRQIRTLLYERGFTISGARQEMANVVLPVAAKSLWSTPRQAAARSKPVAQRAVATGLHEELKAIIALLSP